MSNKRINLLSKKKKSKIFETKYAKNSNISVHAINIILINLRLFLISVEYVY